MSSTGQELAKVQPMKIVHTPPMVTCHNCGNRMVAMPGATTAICADCVAVTTDITKEVVKIGHVLTFCKNCRRLHVGPGDIWMFADRESRELMGVCLRRLGLSRKGLRLTDAAFVWTEPHSLRTKIKVTVRGEDSEVLPGVQLEQTFGVEYIEHFSQCKDCAKSFTANTWVANVQVRQKHTTHKRTFFALEQLILKNKAHKNTVSIEESREGIDFLYSQQKHAVTMVEFLTGVVPCRTSKSSELYSQDSHSAKKLYKFTYSVELVPICKEDLLVLPKQTVPKCNSIDRLVLCHRIGHNVKLVSPVTGQTADLPASVFFKWPFTPVVSTKAMVEFLVLDVEHTYERGGGDMGGKFSVVEATVAPANDVSQTYFVRTHLGAILNAGDSVLGYDLRNTNFNHEQWNSLKEEQIPDIVLVRKVYERSTKPHKKTWKLRRIAPELEQMDEKSQAYQDFLQELEEDADLQNDVEMFAEKGEPKPQGESESEEEYVHVKLDELDVDD